MARITISQAAKAGWASRPTIYRRIKDGRLTIHLEGDHKLLDVADLARVFGTAAVTRSKPAGDIPKPGQTEAVEMAMLEAELEKVKAENARIEADLAEARREGKQERDQARQERDRLLGIVEASQRQIEDQRKSRWPRWLGGGS